ncbi:MAG: hypothetical protein QXS05_06300, partial [Candidatus Bathyarchaeia archaeon]
MSEPSKVEALKRRLEEYEAEMERDTKLFSIEEALKNRVIEVYVPEINRIVKAKKPTFREIAELRKKAGSDEEFAILMLWKTLNAADPNITLEQVEELPFDVVAAIIRAVYPTPLQGSALNAGLT